MSKDSDTFTLVYVVAPFIICTPALLIVVLKIIINIIIILRS